MTNWKKGKSIAYGSDREVWHRRDGWRYSVRVEESQWSPPSAKGKKWALFRTRYASSRDLLGSDIGGIRYFATRAGAKRAGTSWLQDG